MARQNMTYRGQRRNDWRKLNGVTWAEHNFAMGMLHDNHFRGTVPLSELRHISVRSRSKYMPHIGKKERARHAQA